MADEPSWDDIFRPAGGEPARPARPAQSPEPGTGAYPGVRSSDPFAVAAAEATAQTRVPSSDAAGEGLTRRQLREQEEQASSRRVPRSGGGSDEVKPKKKRRALVAVLTIVAVLLAGGGGAAAFVWLNYEDQVREYLGWELPNDYTSTGNGEEVIVTISQNDFGDDVARKLHDEGVTLSFDAVWDYLLAREADGDPVVFFPGSFRLEGEMSADGLGGIHVHRLHEPPRLVGTDGQQRECRRAEPGPDRREMRSPGGVAGKPDRATRGPEHEAAPQRRAGDGLDGYAAATCD